MICLGTGSPASRDSGVLFDIYFSLDAVMVTTRDIPGYPPFFLLHPNCLVGPMFIALRLDACLLIRLYFIISILFVYFLYHEFSGGGLGRLWCGFGVDVIPYGSRKDTSSLGVAYGQLTAWSGTWVKQSFALRRVRGTGLVQ